MKFTTQNTIILTIERRIVQKSTTNANLQRTFNLENARIYK